MKKIASLFLVTTLLSLSTLTAFAADKANPSDVVNVKATALDGGTKLTWDKATDDVGVAGYQVHYGTSSVSKQGQDYDKTVDVKNVLEYSVTGLTNGTKYYFSVTAYDAAGNESASWSKEISITPAKGSGAPAADKTAPKVADAKVINNQEVQIVFSEPIVLPKSNAQDAFDIEDQDKFEPLLVTGAKMDAQDASGATVVLSTSKQKANTQYKVTVAIDIKDKTGNPIVSGTSDTALFKGSATDKPVEDTKGPSVVKVESVDNTHLIVNFDKSIVLSIDPSEDFAITVDGNDKKKLDVLGVKLGTNSANKEDASAIITTSPQELVKYSVKVVNVKDDKGNKITEKSSGSFQGVAAVVPPTGGDDKDLIAPKDVANFIANKVLKGKQYTVTLNWKIPNENKDTKEQLIYKSTDKGAKFDKEASVAADQTNYKVENLDPGEYWFKITEKDNAGNESKGIITKIVLSKTGPEMIGLVAFSLFAGRIVARRKNKK